MKRKGGAASAVLAICLLMGGCAGEPADAGSLRIADWISGRQDRTEIARSVGAAAACTAQEAVSAARDVTEAFLDGAGADGLAGLLPTAEELSGFLPPHGVQADSPYQGEENE